jgi:hypothetical protein
MIHRHALEYWATRSSGGALRRSMAGGDGQSWSSAVHRRQEAQSSP